MLADAHGNVVHLGERDCTIQRRHQKLVEESPSPAVDPELRARIGEIAVDAARAAGYRSAGTIEGLLDAAGNYFFLEMNTRIQVEHTVTEMTTGIDLVREQIAIAAGEPISFRQDGRAGARARDRVPHQRRGRRRPASCRRPGTITRYREPGGPGVRVDSGVAAGSEVLGALRPADREADRLGPGPRARPPAHAARSRRSTWSKESRRWFRFHRALLSHPCFIEGTTCEGLVESEALAGQARALARSRSEASPELADGRRTRADRGRRGRREALRGEAPRPGASARRARAQAARARLGSSWRRRRGRRQPHAGDGARGRGRGRRRGEPTAR